MIAFKESTSLEHRVSTAVNNYLVRHRKTKAVIVKTSHNPSQRETGSPLSSQLNFLTYSDSSVYFVTQFKKCSLIKSFKIAEFNETRDSQGDNTPLGFLGVKIARVWLFFFLAPELLLFLPIFLRFWCYRQDWR